MRRLRRLLLAAPAALLMLGAGAPASADTSLQVSQAQQQQAVIDQVRSRLGANLADALAAQQQLQKSLQDNQAQQDATRARVDAANAKLAELDAEISATDADIRSTRDRIDTERAQLASLARALYVQPSSVLLSLASSSNLGDLLTRIGDFASAGTRARDLKEALGRDLEREQADLRREQSDRDQQARVRDQLVSDLAALKSLHDRQVASSAQLQQKIDQTRYELTALNVQSAALAEQVTNLLQQQQDDIIAEAMQQVWDQVRIYQQQNNVGPIAASRGHSTASRFIWPEGGQLVQGFGPTQLWFEPPYQGFAHFHTGLDLVTPAGTPVKAADDGIVILVGSGSTGYGNYVVLEHQGGLTTLYGHLQKAVVKVGDRVDQGQPIGLEGSTGNSTGAHLHFELRVDQKPVDPAPYMPPGAPA